MEKSETQQVDDPLDIVWDRLYEWVKVLTADLASHKIHLEKYRYWLYDRTLFLLDAFVPIHRQKNCAVQMILLRSLFEIKIKASSYQDDPARAINHANNSLVRDLKNFIKLLKKGNSFTAQIVKHVVDLDKFSVSKPDKRPETVKTSAQEADLAFDYEIMYWLTSMFVHSTSLGLLVHDKQETESNELMTILHRLTSNSSLISLMFANDVVWVTDYLFCDNELSIDCQEFKKELRKCLDAVREQFGIKPAVDHGLAIGEMYFHDATGEEVKIKRMQRK